MKGQNDPTIRTAKMKLIEVGGLDEHTAYHAMRKTAMRRRTTIQNIAQEVLESGNVLDPVQDVLVKV